MTIWADADSLPREVRELIGRRAGASKATFPIRAVFVANRTIPLPPGKNLQAVIVGSAKACDRPQSNTGNNSPPSPPGTADDYILSTATTGDILVTRDIPLASRAIQKGIVALNDRGTLWTAEEVKERLSVRDHMAALRESGLAPPMPKNRAFGVKEAKLFADALDKAIQYSKVSYLM